MSGRSKGFGFVEMEDDEAARTAIANLNETEVQGRKLIVNESQPRQEGDYKNAAAVDSAAAVIVAAVAVVVTAAAGSRGGYGGGGYGGGGGRFSRDY